MNPTAHERDRRFRRILWRSIIVPIVLLSAAALVLSWSVGRLLDHAAAVEASDAAIAQANACLKLAVDMETGLRGYQLTGQREMLEPYQQGAELLPREFDRATEAARRAGGRTELVLAAREAHAAWRAFAAEVMTLRGAGDDVSALALNVRGKLLFDAFRARIRSYVAAEEGRRADLSAAVEGLNARLLQFRLLLLLGLGTGLSLFIGWQISNVAGMFRESELQAQNRAETLRVMLRSIGDAVIATDSRQRITFLNATAAKLTGWSETEAVGQPIEQVFRVVDEASGQPLPHPIAQALHTDGVVTLPENTALVARDGRRIGIADSAAPIRAEGELALGGIVVFHDVTSERSAAATRTKLATIVEASFEAIIGHLPDGTVYEWNRGAEKLFGYSAAEMVGQSLMRLAPPERTAEMQQILERVRGGEASVALTTVRCHKDGTRLDVSVTASPIRDSRGNVVGAAKVVHDVSELSRAMRDLRRAERSLLAARAELEHKVEERTRELSLALEKAQEVDRLKSEFLATMSHELRTPLNSIIGFTELVLAGIPGPINDEQRRQLGMSHNSARHLLHLINDLLDLARIESGRVEPVPENFSPAEVIQEVIETLQPLVARKALTLRADLAVPERICTDRKMFFQILLNLVNNAVKFTPKGHVQVRSRVQDGMLLTEVSDTGIGIKPEQQGMLFEAFRQVDGTSRRQYEGTGLGLYLCRRLVTLLGGSIQAESSFGTGSTFTFTIPTTPPNRP